MLLMAAVDAGASHGYAIVERLRSATEGTFDLPDGTVYPALHRLERAGYLRSSWTESSGRKKRKYELTRKGSRFLDRQKGEWAAFERGVTAVLSMSSS